MGITVGVTGSVLDVLEEQHRRVAELFDRVAAPDEDRPAVLRSILRELAEHVAVERSTVKPVVDERGIGGDLAGRLKEDYERIEKLLVLIERRKFNSPDVPDLLSELHGVVSEHDERSRRHLLPGLRDHLSVEEQAELGRKVADGEVLVTSHPHPHLLSLGPLSDLMIRVAEKWDAARDRTASNRQHPEDESKKHVTNMARAWDQVRPVTGPECRDGEPDEDLPSAGGGT